MDLSAYLESLPDGHGKQTIFAAKAGTLPQLIWQWRTGERPVPMNRCPALEMATGGKVTCEELRPDLVWHRVKDRKWTWHPEGRPLIDVTRDFEAA
jgi:DNA-binding transcriptional regulator YdaS (Cro superfamily)